MALTNVPLCGSSGVGYIPVTINMRYGFFVACFGNVGEDTATPPSNKKAPVGTGLITSASPPHPGWEDAEEADVINPVPTEKQSMYFVPTALQQSQTESPV